MKQGEETGTVTTCAESLRNEANATITACVGEE